MKSFPSAPLNLDQWREPRHGVRIAVANWYPLCRLENQFFKPANSIRMVWYYLLSIGPVPVWRKIRSRTAEKKRNKKVAAAGSGMVMEAPEGSSWQKGELVIFFAPNHPEKPQRICVDERFLASITEADKELINPGAGLFLPPQLEPYVGWSFFSGIAVNEEQISKGLSCLKGFFMANQGSATVKPLLDGLVVERVGKPRANPVRPAAVLFGLGNYAKTQIIPHIRGKVNLCCVHEIDPDQLATVSSRDLVLDTSPVPRQGERYDAWFIAGYHHTHAALAVQALKQGAYAVVEKPVATTWEQYRSLQALFRGDADSRLFACFHRRYSKLTRLACRDLKTAEHRPVDMHCLVYENPLPRLHWYNWPNSGSRLISNGCHWLDYFLFLNGYCRTEHASILSLRGNDLVSMVRLENGARMVMSLTENGSARLGMRELIELRSGDITIRIIDSAFYYAENSARVLCRMRTNPLDAYRRMYNSIGDKIAGAEPADSPESLRSTELMLQLEETITNRGH